MGSQAEQLICKSIMLFDLGVSLEIFPTNPRLRHLLSTAQEGLRSLWQTVESFSRDGTDIEGDSDDSDGFDYPVKGQQIRS